MGKQTTITSGPWTSVYNSSDTSEAYKDKLYAAQNLYRSGNSWPARPPFITTQAAGTLGSIGDRHGRGMYTHVGLDGTSYRFVFVGSYIYRWNGDTTYTDVTPVGYTVFPNQRVHVTSFEDYLVVNNQHDKPLFVASAGCSATPLVTTPIEINSTPSMWTAFGPPVVWDGRLFFVVNTVAGLTNVRDTIVWSEVANPATGYEQTNYANYWQLFQTDTHPIYAMAATELSLVVLRAESMLCITGKTDQTFTTSATRESVEGVGTTTPASVFVHNGRVWFLDSLGRQYRYAPGSDPEPVWEQMGDFVDSALLAGLGATPPTTACACFHPDLKLALSVSYAASGADPTAANTIHAFDAESGLYQGTWDVDNAKLIHAIGVMQDSAGRNSLCVLGESVTSGSTAATSGQMWRQKTLGEMSTGVPWADPSNVPTDVFVTHHLGRNEGAEWIFDRLTLRALATATANATGRTASLTYYTPRGSGSPISAVMGLYTTTPLTGLQTWTFGNEVGAIWGLGPNARGPWLMASVSGSRTAQTVPPFTPISVQLRGRAVPANPFIGVGAPAPTLVDSFNRADSTSSLGVADSGQLWIQGRGTWGIASNRAYCSATGAPPSNSAYLDSTFSDCTVQVTTSVVGPDNGIIVRVSDNANYIRIIFELGTWYLQSFIANAQSTITSAAGTNVNGDVLKVVTAGASITAYLNGTQILTATSSFNQTATMHGLTTSDAVPRFDNFTITSP